MSRFVWGAGLLLVTLALLLPATAVPTGAAGLPLKGKISWTIHCTAKGRGPNSARGSWVWVHNATPLSNGGTRYTGCPGSSSSTGARPAKANGINVSFGVCAQAVCHVTSISKSFPIGGSFSITVRLNQTVGHSTTRAVLNIVG